MTLYFSKTTNGFYDTTINVSIPSDAVEISNSEHEALLQGQSDGKVISADASGRPALTDPPVHPAPAPPPEPTLHEKLASIGLTIDQLKEALK